MLFALAKLREKDLISKTKCFVSYFYSFLFVCGPVFIGLAMFCFVVYYVTWLLWM